MNSTMTLVTILSVLLERISTCAVDDVKCLDQAKKVTSEPNSTLDSLLCKKIWMNLEDVGQEILGIIDPLNFLSLPLRTVEYFTEEYGVDSDNTSGSPSTSHSSSTGTREQYETGSGLRPNPDTGTEGTAIQAPVAVSTQKPQVATAPASAELVQSTQSSIPPSSLPSAPNAAVPPKIPLPSAASATSEELSHKNNEPATAIPPVTVTKQTPPPPVAAATPSTGLTPSSQTHISEGSSPSVPTTLVTHSSTSPLPFASSATSEQSQNSEEPSTITSSDTVSTQTTAAIPTDLTQSTQSLITEGSSTPVPTTVITKSPKIPLSSASSSTPGDSSDSAKPSTVTPSETVPTQISQGEEASPSPESNKPTQSLILDGKLASVSTTGVAQSPKIPLPSAAPSTSNSEESTNPAGSSSAITSTVKSSTIAQSSSNPQLLPTELTQPPQSLIPVGTLPPKIPLPEAGTATSGGSSNPANH